MSGASASRKVHICMVPSVELWQQEASHMGNIVEKIIAQDYLYETLPGGLISLIRIIATNENFFDTGSLPPYKKLLRERHPKKVKVDVLESRNNFRIPDMSTWHGEFRERTHDVSHLAGDRQGVRNEHYEIKPDNDGNTKKGQEKLDDIKTNLKDLGLSYSQLNPGYKRGDWYPPEARGIGPGVKSRKIAIRLPLAQGLALEHKVKRWEAILSKMLKAPIKFNGCWIDIVRRQPGLIQYKICCEIELPGNCTQMFEEALAAKFVRLIYEHLLLGLTQQQQKIELAFVNALRAVPINKSVSNAKQDPTIAYMESALEEEAKFNITYEQILDEIRPLRSRLRDALFSRIRGITGERFMICCDQIYFQQEIVAIRNRLFERNVKMLRGLYGPTTPDYPTSITLVRAGIPLALNALPVAARILTDVIEWVKQHPYETLAIVTVVVILTAAVIFVVASGGTGAVIVVPLTEAALISEGVGTAVGVTTVAVEGTVVTTGVAAAGTTTGLGAGTTLGVEAGLTQSQLLALRFGIGMREAQAVSALGQAAARSSALSEGVLLSEGATAQAVAAQQLQANILVPAIMAIGDEDGKNLLSRALSPEVFKTWRDSIINAGPSVVALSSSQLVTTGVTTKRPDGSATTNAKASIVVEIGRLFLIRLRDSKLTSQQLPALEQEFNCSTYSDEHQGRLHYLGLLRCD